VTSATGAVGRIARESVKLDRSGVELGFAFRCTIGVAIPLVLALLAGQPLAGVSAAFGAMSAGFASRQGVYRTRALGMLVTTLGMAVSGFIGCHTGGEPVANVILTALWAVLLGVLGSLGATATVVGINSVLALIIFSHPPYDPAVALAQAGFVVAGGVLQTILLVLVWPLQRFSGERRVLAAAYRALAAYAGHLPEAKLASPATAELTSVGAALADPQPFARPSELVAFEDLLDEAERIRASLGALATDRHHLAVRGLTEAAEAARRIGAAAERVLTEIADALAAGRAPADLPESWAALGAALDALEPAAALDDANALLGQLRAAWRAGHMPEDRAAASPSRPQAVTPFGVTALGDALETLRANVSPRSAYFQHALRLGAALGLAATAEHVLPLQRGYWIPLTAVLVLRPDFTGTITRGATRVGGTVAGAVIASAIAALHPADPVYLLLAVAFAGTGYALFGVNYGIYSAAVTAYVVFLLAFAGSAEHQAALDRVGATALGGALAVAVYALWPTWSRERVPRDLADLLDAQRRYAIPVLRAFLAAAGEAGQAAIRGAQVAAWLARSNAEASVDAMVNEPVRPKAISVRAALALLAASRRFGVASLTLQSRLDRAPGLSAGASAALACLTGHLDAALQAISSALRERGDPLPLPPLREAQIALKRALDQQPDAQLGALVSETDLMVDAVNTMADVLHRLRAEGG
jgi:uncharacterized membrane protein YccC